MKSYCVVQKNNITSKLIGISSLQGVILILETKDIKDLEQDQRSSLVKQVRRYGDLNTDAILDSNCITFSIPEIDGFIGYRVEAGCAIVFGDPLCAQENQTQLITAFQKYCKVNGWDIVYAIVSESFANSNIPKDKKRILIPFGSKLFLNPSDNPLQRSGSKAVLVRKKVKHAINDKVVINEYLTPDESLEKSMENLGIQWSQSRNGPQVYIAHHAFFKDREGKRWFYASHQDRIVGFLILNELQASSGWLLNNLIIAADAPSGTSELLITSSLKVLETEKSLNVIIGPVTATELPQIEGVNSLFSWIIQMAFKGAKRMFRLDGQRVFWEKFQPKQEPSYVIFNKINIRTVKALMKAMNVKI